MQPETKIGLALGIVLFGFILAIGVRLSNQPAAPELEVSPTLQRTMANQHLPLKPVAQTLTTNKPLPAVDFSQASVIYQGQQQAPNPIQIASTPPAQNGTATSQKVTASGNQKPLTKPVSNDAIYHVVGKGETLSGIAAKYLGTTARYQEIYELNKDQMASPDQLQLGMKLLVVPGSDIQLAESSPPTTSLQEPTTASASSSEQESTEPLRIVDKSNSDEPLPQNTNRFSPAKRSPFTPH